ncbi:MAG: DNA-binding domain-containing protein [Myxococcales bacterium]
MRSAPETQRWLAELQARFSQVLRRPLQRGEGRLRADPEDYPLAGVEPLADGPELGARERIAAYQRQYWFRLLDVLQREYPLTAHLLGLWTFNDYAARFLALHPPRHFDIHAAGDGFDGFMARALTEAEVPLPGGTSLASRALLEAVRIDQAFREVIRAPLEAGFAFTNEHARLLPSARLVPADNWALVSESWPLVALRDSVLARSQDAAVPLPPSHDRETHWLISTAARGILATPLPTLRAKLLQELRARPLESALGVLEQAASAAERTELLAHASAWLSDSVQRGLWKGLLPGER